MTPDPMAVVFDLGGILIDVDVGRCLAVWSRHSGLPAAELAGRFRIDAAYERFERGEIDAGAYYEALRRRLGVRLTDRQLEEGWNAVLGGERPGAGEAVAMAAARGPVFLLTNTNAVHESVWSTAHRALLAPFRDWFVSSRMGCRKPEPAIYRKVIEGVGLPPQRILFFDDAPENVAGALAAGIRAHRVETGEALPKAVGLALGGP